MNEEPPILVEVTNLAVIKTDDQRKEALYDPGTCLQILTNYAGNLSAFVKYFGAYKPEEQQFVLFTAEKLMSTDKEKHREWKKAIRLNQTVRIELLQSEALNRLEGNNVGFEEKMTNKGVTVRYKEVDDLAFAKLIIGDVIAGRIARAKTKPVLKPTGEQGEEDNYEEDEDEALALAMEDA
jgi:hypothetical protein